jgi:hypothetical protein
MNEKKKMINPRLPKAILFALLVILPFVLYVSMSVPVLSYILFGLLLAVFGAIVFLN